MNAAGGGRGLGGGGGGWGGGGGGKRGKGKDKICYCGEKQCPTANFCTAVALFRALANAAQAIGEVIAILLDIIPMVTLLCASCDSTLKEGCLEEDLMLGPPGGPGDRGGGGGGARGGGGGGKGGFGGPLNAFFVTLHTAFPTILQTIHEAQDELRAQFGIDSDDEEEEDEEEEEEEEGASSGGRRQGRRRRRRH